MKPYDDVVLEIIRKSENSDRLDRDAYLSRYPQHAEALTELFNTVELLKEALLDPKTDPLFGALTLDDGRMVPASGLAGDSIPGYRIVKERARGAQGVVYEAVQGTTGRTVALKVLRSRSARSLRWFRREVELAARLSHPNVAAVYDAGIENGRPYCAMELVDGQPLDEFLSKGRLVITERLRLFAKVCAGVEHAHQHGVIHLDLKPSNILVEKDGRPRVVDFGLAAHHDPLGERDTPQPPPKPAEIRSFAGTLAYSCPEQFDPSFGSVGTRSDVYSLGVVLHELLTGRPPYHIGEDFDEARSTITQSAPTTPSMIVKSIDRDLDAIVVKALQKQPEDRYQSVSAMSGEIQQFLSGRPIDQKRSRPGYVTLKFLSRHKAAIGLAMFVLVILGGLAWQRGRLDRQRRAGVATTLRRFELMRRTDLATLREHGDRVAAGNRLAEIAELPPDRISEHLERYESPRASSLGVFEPIVEGMPDNLLAVVRKDDGNHAPAAIAWIQAATPLLDELAARLERESFRFGLASDQYWGLGWRRTPITPAQRVCEALMARAYMRRREGEHLGASSDVEAARRIATDMGDGVLMAHKTSSARCRNDIYSFMEEALSTPQGSATVPIAYIDLMISDPVIPAFSSGLLARRLGFLGLISAAMVSDEEGPQEHLDLAHLDRLLGGYLSAAGSLSHSALSRSHIDAATVGDVVDRYVTCATDWDTRTEVEIKRDIERIESQLPTERETNPALWLVEPPGPEFLIRLETSARRRTTRLLAFAMAYHDEHGRWPDSLADAVPPESSSNMVDPLTGQPFGFEVRDATPYIIAPVADAGVSADAKAHDRRLASGAIESPIASNTTHAPKDPAPPGTE